jgi:catechol 2,3-dioxygenase-like lactoylglutathione lyase family enzyme
MIFDLQPREPPPDRYGPAMSGSEPDQGMPRRLDHGSLLVADAQRSREFYVGGLGLTEVPRPANFDFPGLWVTVGDQQLHIIGEGEAGRARGVHPGYREDELARGYATHLALEVEDFAGYMARLHSRGIDPVGGPRDRGDGVQQAYVADPDGHLIEIMG